eukprot:CAMPEP_0118666762 /NCGR_PEP_ID=MMETSP0785-20121206/19400_1 /TAXON_ID=91992 /ORGANISM="Bolidomonas pacifica, Strain CCMP 1866" /LENGTH=756 /DNA_ID=CAMNT_0006561119 /DNA_START=241 /DNA_END=2511 /DNA_ORIENTATION=-
MSVTTTAPSLPTPTPSLPLFQRYLCPFTHKFTKVQDASLFSIYKKSTFRPNKISRQFHSSVFWDEIKKSKVFESIAHSHGNSQTLEGLANMILRRAEYLYNGGYIEESPKPKVRGNENDQDTESPKPKVRGNENDQGLSNKLKRKRNPSLLERGSSSGTNKSSKRGGSKSPPVPAPPPPEDTSVGVYYGVVNFESPKVGVPSAASASRGDGSGASSFTDMDDLYILSIVDSLLTSDGSEKSVRVDWEAFNVMQLEYPSLKDQCIEEVSKRAVKLLENKGKIISNFDAAKIAKFKVENGVEVSTDLAESKVPVSMSVPNFVDEIPILKVGDICWSRWKVDDSYKDNLYESIIVDVHIRDGSDVVYDVEVFGDSVDNRIFKIGWEEIVTTEDYSYVLDCELTSTGNSQEEKVPKKKGRGWTTKLTGDSLFYSLKVAMRIYDDTLVEKDGKLVRTRALNIGEDWEFVRGQPPLRIEGFNAGKGGRSSQTPIGVMPEIDKETTFTDTTKERVLKKSSSSSSSSVSAKGAMPSGEEGGGKVKPTKVKPTTEKRTKDKQEKQAKANKAKRVPSAPISAPAPTPAATSTTNSSIESMVKKSVSAILKDISSLKTQTSPGQKRVISIGQKIHLNKVQATLSLATEHGFSIPSPTSKDTLISLPLGWPRNPFSSDSEGNGKIKDGDLVPYLEYCDTLEVVESGDMSTSSNNSTSSNSSCTTASAVTAATTPTSNKSVKVWRCDKCKEVSFDTFEKAEKHEKTCGV